MRPLVVVGSEVERRKLDPERTDVVVDADPAAGFDHAPPEGEIVEGLGELGGDQEPVLLDHILVRHHGRRRSPRRHRRFGHGFHRGGVGIDHEFQKEILVGTRFQFDTDVIFKILRDPQILRMIPDLELKTIDPAQGLAHPAGRLVDVLRRLFVVDQASQGSPSSRPPSG